ncbi:demethylmenaquinone methyltransferase [Hydrogenibacillus schlegelii]|uniref:Demethylmenaquinone methyltransferase n=1 Tax=Hydrogenibacillus schlegelii TaxID=1484 RepID=A0A132NBM5_HYDSH|nr:demethylmenaquinone methyltransferase [Hydrogenibacillus schlegelii]KWX07357.1 ubiquinone biosynthesis methyltransferase UbiE [Hydrogenibacillus schlegelii]MBT9282377.1 demethylmenaquinone methyltransferase [Hydrogenibacillus schlegelii]OAR05529.1 demethylmenaquinone methyltransferase [Hydrogenibacillus schlegelii]PTQ54022.1 MAG: 2-heptaprenyl-1,4-naphthoquinone methyltransferase [Hydrogenibacillus schlegelii]
MERTDKRAFVYRVFESIAPAYDRMNTLLSFGAHKRWRRIMLEMMAVRPGSRALDVATGTGDLALALRRAVGAAGEVVGLDFSPAMLARAREKAARAGLADIVWVEGDALALPFPDGRFDYATIGFALRNVPDLDRALAEMARVVRPGGLVVSLELSKPVVPGFREIYYVYFERMLPLLGRWFARRYEEYRWLPESLRGFPDHKGLAARFVRAGLTDVRVRLLFGGIAAVHVGRKPGGEAPGGAVGGSAEGGTVLF